MGAPDVATPQEMLSEAEIFDKLPFEEKEKLIDQLSDDEILELQHDWDWFSRPNQRPPAEFVSGLKSTWVVMAGRGFGKTRCGAEWVRGEVKTSEFVNLIGATASDARDIMIEGEALALDTPIPTPTGWRTMRELQVGDYVFDENGEATEIEWVSPVAEGRPCFEVTFSDEETIIADAEHKWLTHSFNERQYKKAGSVRTTAEIAEKVTIYTQRNHAIRRPGPLDYPERELPIDPYVLGCWLGDGTSSGAGYTTADQEILDEISAAGYTITTWNQKYQYNILGLGKPLRELNLIDNKHIPRMYLEASIDQRRALLQGLMDTDGYIDDTGHCEFDQNKEQFVIAFWELLRSLGMTCRKSLSKTYSKDFPNAAPMYRVQFAPNYPCFRLPRKLARIKPLSKKSSWVTITKVVPVDSVSVKCIAVKNESHLYLAGKGCTPTHNSGILRLCPKDERPVYVASKRQLQWPNGAISLVFTADEPERLRGKQHMKIWADELGAWRYAEAWDQAMMGLRLGKNPQAVVTTTPRPTKLVKDLIKEETTIVTRGSTYQNRSNLAESFFNKIIKKYEGTRLGRQELMAELLLDNPGALWHQEMIDTLRVLRAPPLVRIITAVDPSVDDEGDKDEAGIVVAGLAMDGHIYVMDDLSLHASPDGWATEAVNKGHHKHLGDRIVAEINNGGALVEAVLRTVDPTIPYTAVHASRGKRTRAEPISALYEQGKVHHVGMFSDLEDELCNWDPLIDAKSPNRLDALVWACTALVDPEMNTTLSFGSLGRKR